MNKSQILNFIKKLTKKKIKVKFVYRNQPIKFLKLPSETLDTTFAGFVSKKHIGQDTILINRNSWAKEDQLYQKYAILHEIGHFMSEKTYNPKKLTQAEVDAQIYAINKAKKLHETKKIDQKLYPEILKITKSWKSRYYTRYNMARKKSQKTQTTRNYLMPYIKYP